MISFRLLRPVRRRGQTDQARRWGGGWEVMCWCGWEARTTHTGQLMTRERARQIALAHHRAKHRPAGAR